MPLPKISLNVAALHNKPDDTWIVIDQGIYDISQFQYKHPGGHKVFKGIAGKDATKSFHKNHNRFLLDRYEELKIGTVAASVAEEKKVVSMLSRVLGWRKQGLKETKSIGISGDSDGDTIHEVKEIEVVENKDFNAGFGKSGKLKASCT